MSFRIEIDHILLARHGREDPVEFLVWKDDREGDTDLLCTVHVSEQEDGVHIHMLDARGRRRGWLVDGLLKAPHKIEDKPATTNRVGKIAVFLSGCEIGINRGLREGVEPGDLYCMLSNDRDGDLAALLQVYEVREKMALAKPFWVSGQCPTMKRGWHVFLLDIPEA